MRWRKYDQGDMTLQYRCCRCCHVRTGTLMFGMFELLLHMVALAYITVYIIHPEVVQNKVEFETTSAKPIDFIPVEPYGSKTGGSDAIAIQSDIPSSNVESYQRATRHRNSESSLFRLKKLSDPFPLEQQFFWLLATAISTLFVLMLIYGTLKTRPQLLMPFFCLKLFEFIIACLTSVSISSVSDTRKWIDAQNLPFKAELLSLNNDWLMLIIVLAVVATLFLKAYLLDMVWSCYKYLTEVLKIGHAINIAHHDDEMVLPPKYEDVINMPPEAYPTQGPPPPPYTTLN